MYCTACGARNPSDSNFCRQCGHRLDTSAGPRISEEAFDSALPEDEQLAALVERAYMLRREGNLTDAVEKCRRAIEIRPDSTSAHSLLGQLYERMGHRAEAIREIEEVLRLNPGSIADRVKLDELREGIAPHGSSQPTHIVLGGRDSATARLRPWVLGGAVVALSALVSVGVTLAVIPHNHQTVPVAAAADLPTSASRPGGRGVDAAFHASPPSDHPTASDNHSLPGAQAVRTPLYVLSPVAAPPGMLVPGPVLGAAAARSSRPHPAAPHSEGLAGSQDNIGAGDVLLPASDDSGGSVVSIPVSAHLSTESASGGLSSKSSQVVASVRTSPGPPASGASAAGASAAQDPEAAAEIALGDELKLKGDYQKASRAYLKAVGSAGDETARVYQSLAICAQHVGDNSSAISYYDKAIDGFNKQVARQRNVDAAQSGIKACEAGKKICAGS